LRLGRQRRAPGRVIARGSSRALARATLMVGNAGGRNASRRWKCSINRRGALRRHAWLYCRSIVDACARCACSFAKSIGGALGPFGLMRRIRRVPRRVPPRIERRWVARGGSGRRPSAALLATREADRHRGGPAGEVAVGGGRGSARRVPDMPAPKMSSVSIGCERACPPEPAPCPREHHPNTGSAATGRRPMGPTPRHGVCVAPAMVEGRAPFWICETCLF
jgi:hypothetical protein